MNEQINQALAQLRDVHEPAAPMFWPIPLGWWLLGICVIAAIACFIWWQCRRRIEDRPYRAIRRTANQLQLQFNQHLISTSDYVLAVNRLYKHLLISESIPGSHHADGMPWLTMLAERFNDDAFVTAAGKCLGTIRYTPVEFFDNELETLVSRTLCRVKRLKGHSGSQ